MITIDYVRYGMPTSFDDLEDAQDTIRDCGPDFASVELTLRDDKVFNENGEQVGFVAETDTEEHDHEWGDVELSRFTGNPHRKCLHCSAVNLDLEDDDA